MIYEEQKKLVQQQAQTKAQMARYEDELARKRMQACCCFNSKLLFIAFSLPGYFTFFLKTGRA